MNTEKQDSTTRRYEMMVIIKGDILAQEIEKQLERIRSFISEHKGKIVFEDLWGKRDMAYRIKGQDAGFYAVLYFDGAPEEIKGLESNLLIEPDLIRYLISIISEEKKIDKVEPGDERPLPKEEKSRDGRRPSPAPIKKKEEPKVVAPVKEEVKEDPKKEEKVEEVVVEEKEEVAEAPVEEEAKEEPKKDVELEGDTEEDKLDDVDAKLKSIIDDPDISL